jgi:NADH dehydrogenase (ubiquinone) 1 alpha subcomplex subunit 8
MPSDTTNDHPDYPDDDKVAATSAILHAASHSLFKSCRPHYDLYMSCRQQTAIPSPALCSSLARAVIHCANSHFAALKASTCQPCFRRFWRCLDNNDQNVIYCREEERAFYECVRGVEGREVRELWRGQGPEGGVKERAVGAEEERWRFRNHVWWHKNHKPTDDDQ